MKKIYGATERIDCLAQIGRSKWELIYGFGTDGDNGYTWRERFDHKPTPEEVKDTIFAQINRNTDERILSGFSWNGFPVWLSGENQFNYKAAYDLAVQTEGASLPVRFKFGTDEEPHYHIFETLPELQAFYTSALTHIQDAYNDGWDEKNNIDWTKFE